MPYYDLCSRDLHILGLWWTSCCTHYFLWRSTKCALCLCSMTHYDITMGHYVAMYTNHGITVGNDVARDMHYDITMGNDVATCTYHGIIVHNDVAMNLF